jgi:hypothetical protein
VLSGGAEEISSCPVFGVFRVVIHVGLSVSGNPFEPDGGKIG